MIEIQKEKEKKREQWWLLTTNEERKSTPVGDSTILQAVVLAVNPEYITLLTSLENLFPYWIGPINKS